MSKKPAKIVNMPSFVEPRRVKPRGPYLAAAVRRALLASGATGGQIAAALGVLAPRRPNALKITREMAKRLSDALPETGAKVMVVRSKAGIKLYPPETLELFRAKAKAHKPWTRRKGRGAIKREEAMA